MWIKHINCQHKDKGWQDEGKRPFPLVPCCVPTFPSQKLQPLPLQHSSSRRGFALQCCPHVQTTRCLVGIWGWVRGCTPENIQATFSFPFTHNQCCSLHVKLEFKHLWVCPCDVVQEDSPPSWDVWVLAQAEHTTQPSSVWVLSM